MQALQIILGKSLPYLILNLILFELLVVLAFVVQEEGHPFSFHISYFHILFLFVSSVHKQDTWMELSPHLYTCHLKINNKKLR